MLQEQDALIAELRASLDRPGVQRRQPSIDSSRSSDDDDTVPLDHVVARNIDIDSAVIQQELSGISEPLSVSVLFVLVIKLLQLHHYLTVI